MPKDFKPKQIVDHLSYSAVRAFCTSPAQFWNRYIMRESIPANLTMLAGRAWHLGLEEYYRNGAGNCVTKATEAMLKEQNELSEKDLEKFEKELGMMEQNLQTYASLDATGDTHIAPSSTIEQKVSMATPVDGGLPIVGIIDILDKDGNPVDHKYVGRYTDGNIIKYLVQAWFYFYLTKEITGKFPGFFQISEFKKVPNRDKSSQLKPKVVMYEKKWIEKINTWYAEVSEQIMKQKHFIPNPFQVFGGEDWDKYVNL